MFQFQPPAELPESETARTVRQLLSKSRAITSYPAVSESPPTKMDLATSSDALDSHDPTSDQFSSALPGDSFPTTGQHLMASLEAEIDDLDADSEVELLRHLKQSQARMEQIKRMLVNQRGFIVAALKQMAETPAPHAPMDASGNDPTGDCAKCAHEEREISEERDRTLGSTHKFAAATKTLVPAEFSQNILGQDEHEFEDGDDHHGHGVGGKLCPMCEAAFPDDVDDEAFESHVVEHFCFEDAETLKYIPPERDDS